MAFRPPQRLQTRQHTHQQPPTTEQDPQSASSPYLKRTLEDSQEEWVLFSPSVAPSVKTETTFSTTRTPRTVGLASRYSEVDSLNTAAGVSDHLGIESEEQQQEDEDAELDSLDDGLHAFHEPSDFGSPRARMIRSSETVLPAHDGLGGFGEANSSLIQEHIRQFERTTPRRKLRRTSSAQRTLDALHEVDEMGGVDERVLRIEEWRMEQSRALLEEIGKEARRIRRMNDVSVANSMAASTNFQTKSEFNFSESGLATPVNEVEPEVLAESEVVPPENESWWQRFIRNLIGIDENILSVILGEALPEEVEDTTPTQSQITEARAQTQEPPWSTGTWQHRLLERLARELGILVHQLSEHPGAFSTYLRTQESLPYVGTTTSAPPPLDTTTTQNNSNHTDDQTVPTTTTPPHSALPSFPFHPTLHQQVAPHADPSLWGIEEETEADAQAAQLRRDQEYWEKDLDVTMVFNFLKTRFSSSPPHLQASPLSLPVAPLTTNERRTSNATSRAALIRQHHPLASVARRRTGVSGVSRRVGVRTFATTRTHTSTSSCKSQSAKRSVRSGGSRNYWDVAGSSAVNSGPGGLGMWGEVGI